MDNRNNAIRDSSFCNLHYNPYTTIKRDTRFHCPNLLVPMKEETTSLSGPVKLHLLDENCESVNSGQPCSCPQTQFYLRSRHSILSFVHLIKLTLWSSLRSYIIKPRQKQPGIWGRGK